MKKIIRFFAGLLLILAAAVMLTACGKQEVNMDEFVEFTDSGYDGQGTSTAEFDYKGMLKEVRDKMSDERYSKAKKILKEVTLSPQTAKNCSNDQVVTFEWDIDDDDVKKLEDECKLIVKYEDIEHKVKGLTPLEEEDLFADFSYSVSGYDTYGKFEFWGGESYAKYECDNTEGLKNGDIVTVTASLSDWYKDSSKDIAEYMGKDGKKPASLTKEFEVTGLTELTEYSPFTSISLKCQGLNGSGKASLETDWTDKYYYEWVYTIDKTEELSNDDRVSISVTAYDGSDIAEYAARYYGLKITETEKEYAVEGLTVLPETVAGIDSEVMTALSEEGGKRFSEMVDGWETTTIKSFAEIGTMLAYEYSSWYETYTPYVFVVYESVVQNETDGEVPLYWYIRCNDVKLEDDGSLTLNVESCDTPLNHYSSWWGISGEAFYGPGETLFYVGFDSFESLYTEKIEKSGLIIAECTVVPEQINQ